MSQCFTAALRNLQGHTVSHATIANVYYVAQCPSPPSSSSMEQRIRGSLGFGACTLDYQGNKTTEVLVELDRTTAQYIIWGKLMYRLAYTTHWSVSPVLPGQTLLVSCQGDSFPLPLSALLYKNSIWLPLPGAVMAGSSRSGDLYHPSLT
jgi:hypothetical protein